MLTNICIFGKSGPGIFSICTFLGPEMTVFTYKTVCYRYGAGGDSFPLKKTVSLLFITYIGSVENNRFCRKYGRPDTTLPVRSEIKKMNRTGLKPPRQIGGQGGRGKTGNFVGRLFPSEQPCCNLVNRSFLYLFLKSFLLRAPPAHQNE